MSSLSALMLTINFGKKSLSFVEFIQLSDQGSALVNSADIYQIYTFVSVCVSSVRTSCLPFTLTLNTLVSLWAPGTHGMESRIRQVREPIDHLQ